MHGPDPFDTRDLTIVRPRPGGGRRGAAAAPVLVQTRGADDGERSHVEIIPELSAPGLNPLVRAAGPLLLLTGQLRGSLIAPQVPTLRRQVVAEVRRFEERAQEGGVPFDVTRAARYVLCAALDEAVLSTPWGNQSEWAQQTLLVALHREAWGGEKFFAMLERLSRQPERHLDLLELQYLCLAFGFAGKYQLDERGAVRLSEIQQEVYRQIRHAKEAPPAELSARWRGMNDRRHRIVRYLPVWVVGAAAAAIIVLTFAFYHARLGRAAAPIHHALATIGTEAFASAGPAAPSVPRLKILLAPEAAQGALHVDEQDGRTVITLNARDLFASGGAVPHRNHLAMFRRIAEALRAVPGRVLIVGHTDDLPLASLRYRDNFELSRERAVAIAGVLAPHVGDRSRITWTGVGPSEPRYRPASTPENRARNRRVEIIHVAGS